MKAQLIVVQGKPEGKSIPLAIPRFKIGRGDGCQLRPNNDLVSREHAEFEVGAESVIVRDLGSRNGVRVNGRVVDEQKLQPGDEIAIGHVLYRLELSQPAPAAPRPRPAPGPRPEPPDSGMIIPLDD